MSSKSHWENVYTTKSVQSVSWFQQHADQSMKLIRALGLENTARIIDVGGGASVLVDDLLDQGFQHLSVLDLSGKALEQAQGRLQGRAPLVQWLEQDVLKHAFPRHAFDVWHDRAVFHFLNTEQERQAYVAQVQHAVKPGGHVIVATFAEDGPEQCSGLPVQRYDAQGLHAQFGAPFELIKHEKEAHTTPFGTVQQFIYCYCRKLV